MGCGRVSGPHGVRLPWWPLVWGLALVGSTMLPGALDLPSSASAPEDWIATATAITLQPDLQTETQTQEVQTQEVQTQEVPTQEVQTDSHTSNYTGLSCTSILPPRRGSFYVEAGTGVSVGTVLAFWCREGYQLVGSDKIYCNVRNGAARWSNYLPVCEAIPRPEDRGLRVAVLASVVSGVVILAMSLSFLLCCLQEGRGGRGRAQRREKRPSRRGESWLEREEGAWDTFPPPKIFHLSQRMDPRLAPDSPLYLTGAQGGYDNRAYSRSQESLLKPPLPGLYHSESQLYPHVLLQRAPPPTAPSAPLPPVSLHRPSANSLLHPQTHLLGHYAPLDFGPLPAAYPLPTPAPIYPNPNPTPQRPWQ